MTARRGSKGLSDEDRDLWRRVAETAEPLKKRPVAEAPSRSEGSDAPAAAQRSASLAARSPAKPRKTPAVPGKPPQPALTHGSSAGLDKRNAERLRKGRLPIEGALDLHGLVQDEAKPRLEKFLGSAVRQVKRCVLVITGKGRGGDGGGVLKTQVPRWLNEPGNRALVVSFTHAQPKDGGSGALYILLKRKRGHLDSTGD